jgi:hypothetical protein
VISLMRAIRSSSDYAILMASGFRHWSMNVGLHVRGDHHVSFSERGQHLTANRSSRRSRSTRSRRYFAYTWDAASLAACLTVCLPTTTTSSIDEDSHSPMPFRAG